MTPEQVRDLLLRALRDTERGYGDRPITIADDALTHLADMAGGDARTALNALELAVESTPPDEQGVIHIDDTVAEESIQQQGRNRPRTPEDISAFIKSVRGSFEPSTCYGLTRLTVHPDAALYWLAKALAGEDPEFVMRRRLILAGEDIGLADPNGIVVVTACANALQYVGLPEAKYHLRRAADGPRTPETTATKATGSRSSICPTSTKTAASTTRATRATKPRSRHGSRSGGKRGRSEVKQWGSRNNGAAYSLPSAAASRRTPA